MTFKINTITHYALIAAAMRVRGEEIEYRISIREFRIKKC
jgi:hypothetical protein